MSDSGVSLGTLITIGTTICGALAAAIGYIYRELAAVRKRHEERQAAIVEEIKQDRLKCEEGREVCQQQHLETREQLAELRGRFDERSSVRALIQETLTALELGQKPERQDALKKSDKLAT